MSPTGAVVAAFEAAHLTYTDEVSLHQDMSAALTRAGIPHAREVRLGPAGRIDLLVDGGLGVEVKVAGSLEAVTRQMLRYAHHDQVGALLLVTTRARHAGLPRELAGKPVGFFSLLSQAF